MKPAYFLLFLLIVHSFSYANNWVPSAFNIGTILDQTEMGGNLYLVSFLESQTDEITNQEICHYQISRFNGGTNITPVVRFKCITNYKYSMVLQSLDHTLYMGGYFTSIDGDTTLNYLVCLVNGSFKKVENGLCEVTGGHVSDMQVYNGTLLVSGVYQINSFTYDPHQYDFLTIFDGLHWEKFSEEEFNFWCYFMCFVSEIIVDGNDVIVKGEFDHIGTLEVNNVARYSNGSWSAMNDNTLALSGPTSGLVHHQEDLFMIGNDTLLNLDLTCYLEKWNGSEWNKISRISTSTTTDMISFNGKLFITGIYSLNTAFPNSCISVIDTATGAMTPTLDISLVEFYPFKFFTYKGKLYCTTAYMPKDGYTWAVFKETAITTNVSTKNNAENKTLFAYPNPASSTVQLKGDLTGIDGIEILDMTGKVYMNLTSAYTEGLGLDISALKNGFYTLKIKKEGEYTYSNFIKTN